MTLRQALSLKLTIRPGRRVRTLAGWVRRDQVLLAGIAIGSLQTRRSRHVTETATLGRAGYVIGYEPGWLIAEAGSRDRSAA
jgi:hypothetical protein